MIVPWSCLPEFRKSNNLKPKFLFARSASEIMSFLESELDLLESMASRQLGQLKYTVVQWTYKTTVVPHTPLKSFGTRHVRPHSNASIVLAPADYKLVSCPPIQKSPRHVDLTKWELAYAHRTPDNMRLCWPYSAKRLQNARLIFAWRCPQRWSCGSLGCTLELCRVFPAVEAPKWSSDDRVPPVAKTS